MIDMMISTEKLYKKAIKELVDRNERIEEYTFIDELDILSSDIIAFDTIKARILKNQHEVNNAITENSYFKFFEILFPLIKNDFLLIRFSPIIIGSFELPLNKDLLKNDLDENDKSKIIANAEESFRMKLKTLSISLTKNNVNIYFKFNRDLNKFDFNKIDF